MNLLEIKNLKMDFGAGADALRAVDGVSLTIGASASSAKAAAAKRSRHFPSRGSCRRRRQITSAEKFC